MPPTPFIAPASTEGAPPAAALDGPVQAALDHIERSSAFRSSRRHRSLLRHLVQRALVGDLASLKESVLAVEVFGRPASRFDPKTDTIVRVETRRLRQRLDAYYRDEGQQWSLRIELPVGSYVPLIATRGGAPPGHEATRRARDLIERGQYLLRQPLARATLEQALERFDAALREAPDSVAALVGAGRAWLNLGLGWHHDPGIAAEHAAEALQRALALDPQQVEAQVLLGVIHSNFERELDAARACFERAVGLAPGSAFAHQAFGGFLLNLGELAGAEAQLLEARRLDPLYANARMGMVNLRVAQGRLDDAQSELDAMFDLAPQSLAALGLAAVIAMQRGDGAAAVAFLDRACLAAPGHPGAHAARAGALGFAGRVEEAQAVLAHTLAEHGDRSVSPYMQGLVAARCGHVERALALLQAALDEGDPNAPLIAHDPSLQSLHGHPQWPALAAASRQPRRPHAPSLPQ